MENLNIFIRSIFVDNMIFAYFLGMCSFIAVSKNVKTAFGLGIAVTFMLVVTLPVNYLLQTYVLSAGALSWLGPEYADIDLSFLSLIMFIAVIASMTQLVEMTVEKYSPALYSSLGIFLPLIAVRSSCSREISRVSGLLYAQVAVGDSDGSLPSRLLLPFVSVWLFIPTFPSLSVVSVSHLFSQLSWV